MLVKLKTAFLIKIYKTRKMVFSKGISYNHIINSFIKLVSERRQRSFEKHAIKVIRNELGLLPAS